MDFLRLRRLVVFSLVVLVTMLPTWAATREYQLKAAFIFNFIKFVEWPQPSGPIRVGILGTDPFEGELKKLEQKTVEGRAVKVTVFSELDQAKSYQVVFAADPAQAQKLVQKVAGLPVLTISDSPSFSQKGGGITLLSSRNRIRFSVNTETLKKSSLRASSKLLGLAAELYSQESAPSLVASAGRK